MAPDSSTLIPTYDYECSACGHKFELFQSYAEAVKKKCPECKKSRLKRLFGTGAAIVFKGSGFYQTDYRSDSYKKAASAEKGSGEGKSAEGKSGESKSSESKSSESKSSESKSSESKSGESKSGESKSGESKSGGDAKSPANGASAPAKSGKDSSARKE